MTTTTAVNTACAVTNNAGQPVVILDAYNSATDVENNTSATGYQQQLKVLGLASGGEVLAASATDSVTLDDTRESNGQTQPNYLYQLLVSQPVGLFPVMDVGESIDFTSLSYPPITVTEAAAKNMALGFNFIQNLMAYPGSKLATGFVNALNTAQAESTPQAMMQDVADYFNTTDGYKGLDFPSYLCVSTHMAAFAWTWGLSSTGTPGRTYYLYASSNAGGGSSNASAGSQGSVAVSLSQTPTVSDPADPNSGYSVVLTTSDGNTVNLSFDGGQFVDNTSVDVPSICLQGSYALKSTFTQNSSDNVLWPILVGTVDGAKVIGVDQEPPDAFTTWLKSLWPTSFNDWMNTLLKLVGIWMAIDFVKQKLAGKKDRLEDDEVNENDGQPPSEQQQADANADADQIEEEAQAANQGLADRIGGDANGEAIEVPDAAELPQAQVDANAAQSDALNEVQGDELQGAIDEYQQECESLAEIEVNPQLEDAFGDLVNASQELPNARESGEFGEVTSSLGDAQVSINESVTEMGSAVSEQLKQEIQDSQAEAAEYEEAADTIEEQSDAVEGGDEDFDPEFEI